VNWQSLLVQTEYLATLIGRNDHDNVFFDGWYINMGWVIAGNQYRYKRDQAVLGQVVPKHPYGAWEIAARYSEIDLADHDIAGGRERNLTLGINWYPAKWCRFMANYIHVNANDNQRSYHPQIWALRAQLLLNQKLK
jgi:phosphate-selective porin OprO/OprP